MRRFFCYILIALFLNNTCMILPSLAQEKTQLEVREYQTRTYDTKDTKMVMKAVIDTLQDDGFVIDNSNTDLGLITATKDIILKPKSSTKTFFSKVLLYACFGLIGATIINSCKKQEDNSKLGVNVNISSANEQCKVRTNFVPSVDEKFYQDFFAKIDKSIFIQKEKI